MASERPPVGPPRGILHGHGGTDTFRHDRKAPCAALKPFVAHYWMVSWDLRGKPPFLSETLPHPSVHIVFEPRRREVGGVATGRFSRKLSGVGLAFGIKFRPGGFQPFFGGAVGTLANRKVGLTSVFGSDAVSLRRGILAAADFAEQMELAEAFLLQRLPLSTREMETMRDLVERLAVDRTLTRVEQLTPILGTDKRRLQRLFHKYVGVSPKWVIQRYRLHEAAEQIAADPSIDMLGLAHDLGYFDQAHFIRDFKAMVGRSPGRYASDRGKDMASRRR